MKKLGQVTDKQLVKELGKMATKYLKKIGELEEMLDILNGTIHDHQDTINTLEEEIDELKIRIDGLLEENKDLEIIRRVLRVDTYGEKY